MNAIRLVVALAFAVIASVGLVYVLGVRDGGAPAFPETPPSATPERLELGRYLVTAGDCIACHTAIGGEPFAGGRPIVTPFGTVHSTNLTPDVATGLGTWSRDDFWRALHHGRSKDGRLLYPAFPYPNFTRVTRADADAMFDYLRTLRPVSRANAPHALRFPYGTQAALAVWRALFFRAGAFVPDSARGEAWNRGAYLVQGLGHCDACHAERNAFGATRHDVDLGGGLIPLQNWYAPPLGASGAGGGARWDADDIERLLRTGASRHAMAMGPMAEVVYRSTQHLSAADARAIATYLQSLPPVTGGTEGASVPYRDDAEMARGASVYEEHCARCHGASGEGLQPAYPPLAGNPSVAAAFPGNAIKAVLYGGYPPVTAGNPRPFGMPPFFLTLKDADIAAVLTYVRGSWGHRAPPVRVLDVERYRNVR